mmetsp:Transcript_114397/g.324051  ORF Transcript_114397/g.324051 Transcript_114397/m.324051 type:complete len:365 (+) Transcript_114397:1129-2223(+)
MERPGRRAGVPAGGDGSPLQRAEHRLPHVSVPFLAVRLAQPLGVPLREAPAEHGAQLVRRVMAAPEEEYAPANLHSDVRPARNQRPRRPPHLRLGAGDHRRAQPGHGPGVEDGEVLQVLALAGHVRAGAAAEDQHLRLGGGLLVVRHQDDGVGVPRAGRAREDAELPPLEGRQVQHVHGARGPPVRVPAVEHDVALRVHGGVSEAAGHVDGRRVRARSRPVRLLRVQGRRAGLHPEHLDLRGRLAGVAGHALRRAEPAAGGLRGGAVRGCAPRGPRERDPQGPVRALVPVPPAHVAPRHDEERRLVRRRLPRQHRDHRWVAEAAPDDVNVEPVAVGHLVVHQRRQRRPVAALGGHAPHGHVDKV